MLEKLLRIVVPGIICSCVMFIVVFIAIMLVVLAMSVLYAVMMWDIGAFKTMMYELDYGLISLICACITVGLTVIATIKANKELQ